ncbi:RNA polymerase sigma-70 factor [Pedobacter antarcticus 4BY]|uniref:RNA polymerase sigma-70 factor n=2 Tax=Pedobacter antarcticus TaxID=34086 RepID=A0A081PHJ4_9SPHI|nr:sigma-70 family RNA polymerase sigma factor [Pedobacter antarcticus]KEQ30167.1 RNA polymerase sigma-70 factor [Pedobacter antarcticus 4BY]SFE50376.1 RNA polymerase, sigma subunit, SigZ [Pedobacter antarcticus]
METQFLWNTFSKELYFFILKRVNNTSSADDILQNTFFKVHKNISTIRQDDKVKAWLFQIARNEIVNFYNQENVFKEELSNSEETENTQYQNICCFNKFINNLPVPYREVIEIVYIKGLKQSKAATLLGITLPNVKARIKRAKDILKNDFYECCKYEFDITGKLTGEPNCATCGTL